MPTFTAQINPLKFLEVDCPSQAKTLTADSVLDFLSDPEVETGVEAFLRRYREVDALIDPLFFAPAEKNILQKLVWPLRHAKGNYAIGNYVGCVAMCGMVGEMVAILLWDICDVSFREKVLDKTAQKALFGSDFERLGQERRVQVLKIFGLIDDQTKIAFDGLREIRRSYLHFFSKDHVNVVKDARDAYQHALKVVEIVLGQTFHDGRVELRPDLMSHLRQLGIVSDEDEQ